MSSAWLDSTEQMPSCAINQSKLLVIDYSVDEPENPISTRLEFFSLTTLISDKQFSVAGKLIGPLSYRPASSTSHRKTNQTISPLFPRFNQEERRRGGRGDLRLTQ